ncbi:MAG: lauroyl acyltransferase [Leptospiraceae bacterium]|nr:lauroyl acyltransferase [Leptospiraceae bacterium]MCK6382407.1 lauroyl acyltransferase [Leptospiraceae bacterium]
MKKFSNLILFLTASVFYFPFRILPYRVCLFLGVCIVNFFYPFAKKHKKIAKENLCFAFPTKTEKEISDLVKKHFRHIGILLGSTLFAPRIDKKWVNKYLIYEEKSLELEKKIRAENKSAVIVMGHLGVWEIFVQLVGLRFQGVGMYKKIRNPLVDSMIFKMRSKNKIILYPMEESVSVLKAIKKGYWTAFGPDQNAGKAGIFINFFNRPASTYVGPVMMAYAANSRLLFYSITSLEKGRVLMRMKDIGFIEKEKFETKEKALRFYTEKWVKLLEEEIKLFPEQYFWVHRRWRTKPGDFPDQK